MFPETSTHDDPCVAREDYPTMLATLAMTAALSFVPQQGAELAVTNERMTYGYLGATRKGDAAKLLAGDALFVSFDIQNLKVGEAGLVQYEIGMKVTDDKDKLLFSRDPQKQEAYNSLGGNSIPGFAATDIGTDTPPGQYTLTVTVTDRAAKATKELVKKFEVLPPAFGLVRLSMSYDKEGRVPAPPIAVPGQLMLVNCFATGFGRDAKKLPNLTVKMRITENGKPTLDKDVVGIVKEAPENFKLIPLSFFLYLNRPGKFTVELTATDELTKKEAKQSFDVTVVDAK